MSQSGHNSNHLVEQLKLLLLAKGKVLVNLNKSFPCYEEADQIRKKTGTLSQVLSKTKAAYPEVSNLYPKLLDSLTFMPVVSLDKPEAEQVIDEYQKQIKPVAFELILKSDTPPVLVKNNFIPARGSKTWINSLWASLNGSHKDDMAVEDGHTTDSWDWIINHGARIMQTDRSKELLAYLRKRKLHN